MPEQIEYPLIAWDTETDLIAEGNLVPDLICSSFATPSENGHVIAHLDESHNPSLKEMLTSCEIIGHNLAYDLSVAAKHDESFLPLIWKLLSEDRAHDTMLREMLINLTMHGNIDIIEDHGINRKVDYSLGGLVQHYLNIDISSDKDDVDAARTNYHLVKELPIGEWPENFVQYAADDAKYTGLVFLEQELKRQQCIDETGYDPFVVESFRVKAHFALRLLEIQGSLLDPLRVVQVTQEFEELYTDPRLVEPLVNAGFVIPAKPPTPYANGAKDHQPECFFHKDHPDWKKGRKKEPCACPVKMKGAEKEKSKKRPLHQYVWELALQGKCDAWAADATVEKLKEDGFFEEIISGQNKIRLDAVGDIWKHQANDELLEYRTEYEEIKGSRKKKRIGELEALIAESVKDLKEFEASGKVPLPTGWNLTVDKEWIASFATVDPLMEIYAERQRIQKIVTSYLPHLYSDIDGHREPETQDERDNRYFGKVPAERVHASYSVLKRTGRTSSFSSKLYPSWNGQQVDPRIRPCVIPEEGRVIFSIDYSAMELCTAAQKCIDLFGYSVLADKINAGVDTHAFLGAQIAYELDPTFKEGVDEEREEGEDQRDASYRVFDFLKSCEAPCHSTTFGAVFKDSHPDAEAAPTWKDFFKHYRKFAKPTGLGSPGGRGPKPFVAYAKATYGVSVDLDTAKLLQDVWKDTYPELAEYLRHVGQHCIDIHHSGEPEEQADGTWKKKQWYAYDTPLGMHRAKCDYCACANGGALQAFSAEGALYALQAVMEETSTGSLSDSVFPALFIHDEIVGEIVLDENTDAAIKRLQGIMASEFSRVTPDVKISTEACLMRRWDKYADPVINEDGSLGIWEPKQ